MIMLGRKRWQDGIEGYIPALSLSPVRYEGGGGDTRQD